MSANYDKAFLTFSLGPVQTFIAAARTVRDLWSGSYVLSWLTFQATGPVRRAGGELVFPALQGNPLLDLEQGGRPSIARLLAPCLPNRFTGVVNAAEADDLAGQCKKACLSAWAEICKSVHGLLASKVGEKSIIHAAEWDRLWEQQVTTFFELHTAVLPWADCDQGTLDRLLEAQPPAHEHARLYMGQMDLLGRLAEALRSVRHVPAYCATGDVPQKCSLLGTYEQMGPALLEQSRAFWTEFADKVRHRGTHTRKNERLCALSLVKRFAWAAFFVDRLGLDPEDLRFDDTATEAARLWLQDDKHSESIKPDKIRKKHKDWSGQWLHWTRPDQDKEEEKIPDEVWKAIQRKRARHPEPVPTYYAILMIDGDDMGKWLRGEKGLFLGQALHLQLSKALTEFALKRAPQTVEQDHPGTLIYAGGDDVLALLPTRAALACARDLNDRYRANWTAQVPASGPDGGATVSAGLAIVHAKEDLRFALNAARGAEAMAKAAGKDALTVRVCRRSGEHASATLPWALVPRLETLVEQFADDISDRWTYRLRGALPTLAGRDVPLKAFTAETTRLLNRLEAEGRRSDEHRATVLAFLQEYVEAMKADKRRQGKDEAQNRRETLAGFVTVCQGASFLARGRDE